MPRRRNRGGRGVATRRQGPANNDNPESDGVLDSDSDAEVEETPGVGGGVEARGNEEPQPGPSSKSKLARGGKKKGKKTDRNEFGAEEAGTINRMSEVIDDVMKFLSDIATGILPLLEGKENLEEKKKVLKRLHDVGVDMIKAKLQLQIVPDAIMTAYNELDLEELVENEKDNEQLIALLDEFDEASKNEIAKRNKEIDFKMVFRNPTYQQYLEVLDQYYERRKGEKETKGDDSSERVEEPNPGPSALFDVSSEGLEALSDYIPTTDPFTRRPLKDPYINSICKHVYEYQSVMDMIITSKNKTRCPYPGCANKKYITLDDLVKDPVIAAKIIRRIQDETCGVFMTVD